MVFQQNYVVASKLSIWNTLDPLQNYAAIDSQKNEIAYNMKL